MRTRSGLVLGGKKCEVCGIYISEIKRGFISAYECSTMTLYCGPCHERIFSPEVKEFSLAAARAMRQYRNKKP